VSPLLDIPLRPPTARYGVLAFLLGALAIAVMCLPITIENVPPQFRALPAETRRFLIVVVPWMVLLIAVVLGAVAVRIARSAAFRVVVEEDLLRFPLRTGGAKVLQLRDVVAIECNAAGDHMVILTKGHRYLLPWYVMPRGKSPGQVAEEVAGAVGSRVPQA